MNVINHFLDSGQKLIVKVNGAERVNVTIPEQKILQLTATEVYVLMAGDVIEVEAGSRHWSHTVPQGKALLISEELLPHPIPATAKTPE